MQKGQGFIKAGTQGPLVGYFTQHYANVIKYLKESRNVQLYCRGVVN